MNEKTSNLEDINKQDEICIWNGEEACNGCKLKGKLHCHLDKSYSVKFALPFLIFIVPVIIGLISLVFPLNIISVCTYIGYLLLFFLVWEPRMLCSHCPFYRLK
ncbi:MAG: hypothetical protein ACTSUE_17110 [Promethearchaeota archaeon]